MSLLTMLIIVAFLFVGALAFAICFEGYKNSMKKPVPSVSIPIFGDCSPHEVAIKMVGFVCTGLFLMHTLLNNAPPFDDAAFLARYKAYIKNPSVITYLQNVKGGSEYE
ncbi:hypothetical protein ACYULU_07435 [Breznakiellaceae bacterium SP9]